MNPHFSRASPLNDKISFFIVKKLIIIFFKKVGVATYFFLFLKRTLKQEIKP